MTPGELLAGLEARRISLRLEDGYLRFHAPPGAFTELIRAHVAVHRPALLTDWRCPRCGRIVTVLYGIGPFPLCRECHVLTVRKYASKGS